MVKRNSLLEGHLVKEATLTSITLLSPENSVQEVINIILAGTEKDFVVVENNEVLGVITQKVIIKYAKTPMVLIKDIMDKDFKMVDAAMEITKVLELMGREKKSFFPVALENKSIGAVDMTNISEFILLESAKN